MSVAGERVLWWGPKADMVCGRWDGMGRKPGSNGFLSLVRCIAGTFHSRMIAEFADGSSNVREIWKFFFKH